jgi:hypothetical protein
MIIIIIKIPHINGMKQNRYNDPILFCYGVEAAKGDAEVR